MIASTQTNHPIASIRSGSSQPQTLEEACVHLKKSGLRVTQPRIAIFKALISQTGPASIEQIHQALDNSACDLVTVYRCLAAFENIGIVRRSFFHNGTSLYKLERPGSADYHIIHKADKSIRPLPENAAAELASTINKIENELRAQGYAEVSHSVEFFVNGSAQAPATTRLSQAANIAASTEN